MAAISILAKASKKIIPPPSIKGWGAFLIILVVVSLLLVSVKFSFKESMVIYAYKDKPDFMQIFFPINDAYSEKNSERSLLLENAIIGLEFTLPGTSINHIRIDPANEAADVIITKVELRRLLGTDTYMPDDLVTLAQPIQMIDKLEVTSVGLLVRSSGNDPAFELQLNRPSLLSVLIKLFTVSVFLSILLFFSVTTILTNDRLKSQREKVHLVTIPLLISVGIATLFYPGSMSYDTLHALDSARNGVTESIWPPMVSYIWRFVDVFSTNPSAMHFSQISLLLISIFTILFLFSRSIVYSTIFLLMYLSIPAILGTIAVIWKDVLMAAFFIASFAIIVFMKTTNNRWTLVLLSLLAIFMLFLGVCTRHNAITAAVPLFFYLSLILCLRVFKRSMHVWLGVVLLSTVLICTVFISKKLVDSYSFPSFERMSNSTNTFIQTVRVLDVAGASLCVGSNLFAEVAPNLTLAEIRNMYDPKHANLSKTLLDREDVYNSIDRIWLSVAINHPICFFNNKFELTKYLIGANKGVQFLITHPSINDNEYGYRLPESSIRDAAFLYIIKASQLFFLKPWFIYLISLSFFIYMIRTGRLTAEYFTIFLSAIFYLASFVAFGNAADARLLFYTTSTLSIFTFVSMLDLIKRHK